MTADGTTRARLRFRGSAALRTRGWARRTPLRWAAGLVLVGLLAWLAWYASLPAADARGHRLGVGPPVVAYPWPTEPDPNAEDRWGFIKRQCTSYAGWYLNTHGVPFAERTRGPAGPGVFFSAGEWDRGAVEAGFPVSRRPAVGSVAQWHKWEPSPPSPRSRDVNLYLPYRDELDLTAGPYGHVAVVVRVLPDDSVLLVQYNGADRQLQLVHGRAPRYLYIGVRRPPAPPVCTVPIAAPGPAVAVPAAPARRCR